MQKSKPSPVQFSIGSGQNTPLPPDLPFRLVILGHFSAKANTPDLGIQKINPDNFDAILSNLLGTFEQQIPNYLGGSEKLNLSIQFRTLKDFTPLALIQQVTETNLCFQLYQGLERLIKNTATATEISHLVSRLKQQGLLKEIINVLESLLNGKKAPAATASPQNQPLAPAPSASSAASNSVDRLFDLVEKPGQDPVVSGAMSAPIEAFLKPLLLPPNNTIPTSPLAAILQQISHQLNLQLRRLLHDPVFKHLESQWRGLKFLVDRLDKNSQVSIEIAHVEKNQLVNFSTQQLVPVESGNSHSPMSAWVICEEFSAIPHDVESLQQLAEQAEILQAPLITAIASHLFTPAQGVHWERMDNPAALFATPQFDKWNALREKDCAQWLAICHNRFLLREPYTAAQSRLIPIEEVVTNPADYLWANPVWMVCALMIRSFNQHLWPTEMTGPHTNRIENLPLAVPLKTAAGGAHLPVEYLINFPAAESMASVGIISLVCQPHRDYVFILQDPIFRQAQNSVSHTLAYQLFVSRMIALVMIKKYQLGKNYTQEQLQQLWQHCLTQILQTTGPDASLQVEVEQRQNQAGYQLNVQLRTGQHILPGVVLEFSLGL